MVRGFVCDCRRILTVTLDFVREIRRYGYVSLRRSRFLAVLGFPGLSCALLGSPVLFWLVLGSPVLSWAVLGFPVLSWLLLWALLSSPVLS